MDDVACFNDQKTGIRERVGEGVAVTGIQRGEISRGKATRSSSVMALCLPAG